MGKVKSIIKTIFCNITLYLAIVGCLAICNKLMNKSYDDNLKLRYRYTRYKGNVISIQDYFKKILADKCGDGYTTGWAILEKSTKTYYFEDVRMILNREISAPKIEDRIADAVEKKDYREIYMPNIAKYNPYYSKSTTHIASPSLLKFVKYAEKRDSAEAFYCNEIGNCARTNNDKENLAINFAFGKYKGNNILEGIINSNHPTVSIAMILVADSNVPDITHGFWLAKMQHYKYITNKCDGKIGKNILEKMVREIH